VFAVLRVDIIGGHADNGQIAVTSLVVNAQHTVSCDKGHDQRQHTDQQQHGAACRLGVSLEFVARCVCASGAE